MGPGDGMEEECSSPQIHHPHYSEWKDPSGFSAQNVDPVSSGFTAGVGRVENALEKASAPTEGISMEPSDSPPCTSSHTPTNTKG